MVNSVLPYIARHHGLQSFKLRIDERLCQMNNDENANNERRWIAFSGDFSWLLADLLNGDVTSPMFNEHCLLLYTPNKFVFEILGFLTSICVFMRFY